MIGQADHVLNRAIPWLEDEGCAIMDIFFAGWFYAGIEVSRPTIVEKVGTWKIRGWINSQNEIQNWGKILRNLGLHVEYLGHQPRNYSNPAGAFFTFAKMFNPQTGYHHFVVNEGDDILYDSLGERKVRKQYIIPDPPNTPLRVFRFLS